MLAGFPDRVVMWFPLPGNPRDPSAVASCSFSCLCSRLLEMAVWTSTLASSIPTRTVGLRGSWRGVLYDLSACPSHPILFSSAVGPFTKPVLISWLETREPWGLNVQEAQPQENPGAAPAGEFQRLYQILLLQHHSSLKVFYTKSIMGNLLHCLLEGRSLPVLPRSAGPRASRAFLALPLPQNPSQ